jgi:hypothetical protein
MRLGPIAGAAAERNRRATGSKRIDPYVKERAMKRILSPLLAALALMTATLAIAQSSNPSQTGTQTPAPTQQSQMSSAPASGTSTTPTTETSTSTSTTDQATSSINGATMPKTASPLPTMALAALLALVAGASLLRMRRRA